jgi:phosphoribosylglycinamide formyltransferase-1
VTRVAILASGEGSIAQALLDASARGELAGAEVALVVSDRTEAPVLGRANRAGAQTLVFTSKGFADRTAYSEALARELKDRGIELVCLSGFMKILAPGFVKAFEGRILNTHAALLPAFPGAHPVRDTLAWGAKLTGATVHFVDQDVDHGPIILQEAVPVFPGDDEATLHERIKEAERRLFPEAVRLVVAGRTRVSGRTVVIDEPEGARA